MSAASDLLRSLHVPGTPLVLPNAWDAPSARAVVAAGFPVVATSSAAVAESLGYEDHEGAPADEVFAATARIAAAVFPDVPVTADVESGYGLAPEDVVERLLAAGASGCNLEDTDHRGTSVLVDPAGQAARLAAVRAAAGDALVLNARIDTYARQVGGLVETIDRARRYLDAGADCVYPIGLADEAEIAALVEALPGAAINVLQRPGAPTNSRLAELGVARISYGSGLYRKTGEALAEILRTLSP